MVNNTDELVRANELYQKAAVGRVQECLDVIRKNTLHHAFAGLFLSRGPIESAISSRLITDFKSDSWVRTLGIVFKGQEGMFDFNVNVGSLSLNDEVSRILIETFQSSLLLYTLPTSNDGVYIIANGEPILVTGLYQSMNIVVSSNIVKQLGNP